MFLHLQNSPSSLYSTLAKSPRSRISSPVGFPAPTPVHSFLAWIHSASSASISVTVVSKVGLGVTSVLCTFGHSLHISSASVSLLAVIPCSVILCRLHQAVGAVEEGYDQFNARTVVGYCPGPQPSITSPPHPITCYVRATSRGRRQNCGVYHQLNCNYAAWKLHVYCRSETVHQIIELSYYSLPLITDAAGSGFSLLFRTSPLRLFWCDDLEHLKKYNLLYLLQLLAFLIFPVLHIIIKKTWDDLRWWDI